MRWWSMAAVVALTSSVAATGRARLPRVSVDVQDCRGFEPAEVERIAAIELSARLVEETRPIEEVTRVVVDCHDPAVELRVSDPVSGKLLSRTIDLTAIDHTARARVLALAVAELVSSGWMEVEYNPDPIVVPEESVAPPEEREAARTAARERVQPSRYVLLAGGRLRWFTGGSGPLLGGGVRLSLRRRNGGVLGGFAVEGGTWNIAGGELSVTTASGAIGYSRYLRSGRWMLATTGGARLGWGWLGGHPAEQTAYAGQRFGGPWGGPLLRLGADFATSTGLEMGIGIEGGAAVAGLGATVDGRRETGVSGAWIGAELGLGLSQ